MNNIFISWAVTISLIIVLTICSASQNQNRKFHTDRIIEAIKLYSVNK